MLFLFSLLLASALSLSAHAQTNIYFTFDQSISNQYPYVCMTGTLSCTANSSVANGYACQSLVSGTHTLYAGPGLPSYVSSMNPGSLGTDCESHPADNQLPIDAIGLQVIWGTQGVCSNIRIDNATLGTILSDPDANVLDGKFTYNTSQSSVPSCATAVPTSASGTVQIGFTYSNLGANDLNYAGAGTLSCASLGSNEYNCTSLVNGIHYQVNMTNNVSSSITLTSETECNGFGDGFLPLDYEGISFGTNSNFGNSPYNGNSLSCISIYGPTYGSSPYIGADFYEPATVQTYYSASGNFTFSYTNSTTYPNPATVCTPLLTPYGFSAKSNSANGIYQFSAAGVFAFSLTALAMFSF